MLILSASLALVCFVHAEEMVWKDQAGNLAGDTAARRSKNGFGGQLIVTPDADWKEKWDTSPETVPQYTTSETVERGKQLFILIFFVNPKVDDKNNANVTCDIQSIRPDGSFSINHHEVVCFRGKLEGSAYHIRLSAPVIKFVGEPKDPAGKWMIRVTLKDNYRNVRLPLQTSFMLK